MIHEVWRSGLVRYHGYEWPPASTDGSAVLFLAVGGSVYDWHGMEWNGPKSGSGTELYGLVYVAY